MLYFSYIILVICPVVFSTNYGCRDESNRIVDWFVNYKIPKLEKGYDGTYIAEGKGYAYMSSTTPGQWILSNYSVTMKSSMLAKTLQTVFDNKEDATYIFYNDEPPAGYNGTALGHMKGVVAFDENTGFWLIHSIPKFSGISNFEYPSNALENGQSVLCVTFKISSLNEICKQLLHCRPKIYEKKVTNAVLPFLDETSKTIFTEKPAFNRKPPYKRIVPLKSAAQGIFMSFVKGGQLGEDVYSGVIAQTLRSSLATETWRRGEGTFLPPSCNSSYTVTDASFIKMSARNGTRNVALAFSSKEDHSKWAVSAEPAGNWVCVGDMNRMASQERRGGGALCFQSASIGNAYQSIISDSDHCPA